MPSISIETPRRPPLPVRPEPRAGSSPTAARPRSPANEDAIARPSATPPLRPPATRAAIVDGTPEVLLAGAGLSLLGLASAGVEVADAAASLGPAAASAGRYASNLARSIARSLGDPAKTGEHIAEGIVGGAAWASAAASVAALADAARSRITHAPAVRP
jgi:hypothetical protein